MTTWLPAILAALLLTTTVAVAAWLSARRRVRELERREAEASELSREHLRLQRSQALLSRLLGSLPQIAGRLYGEESVRKIPATTVEIVRQLFEPEEAVVLLRRKSSSVDPSRERQLIVAAATEGCSLRVGSVVRIGEGELGVVAARRQAMDRDDLDRDAEAVREAGGGRFRTDLAVPVLLGEELVGVLAISRPRQRRAEDKLALRAVAQLGALAMNHRSELSRVRSVADLDPLTGILNKGVLHYRLSELIYRAERKGGELAIFLFDLDHFKNYNDRNGHLAGDQLLRELAAAVEEEVRAEDLFGRYGGEEFLLILPGRDISQGAAAAETIRRRIERHSFVHGGGQPLGRVTVSGGVAAFPEHGLSSSELLRAADLALYAAKREGRNRVAKGSSAGLFEEETAEPEIVERPPGGDAALPEEAPLEVKAVPTPRGGEDDLTAIRGIGQVFAERLRELGIINYGQIAALNWATAQQLADRLELPVERVIRDRWIEQARALESSKRGGRPAT